MEYVIWGAGFRGKLLYDFLGANRVIAFIDCNPALRNALIEGKKVITYSEFKKYYKKYPVIISMLDYKDAEYQILADGGINYFVLSHQPAECYAQYSKNVLNKLPFDYDPKLPCVFYGINLIGTEIYSCLEGKTDIYVLPSMNDRSCHLSSLRSLFSSHYINALPAIHGEYNVFLSEENFMFTGEDCHVYNIFDFSYQIDDYFNSEIAALKKKFSDQRCFIVATGPSLRILDLDELYRNGEYCISMNKICEAFSRTKWRPNLYLSADRLFITQCYEQIKNLDVNLKFIADYVPQDYPYIPQAHMVMGDMLSSDIPFSEDVSRITYVRGTITYACLQFAVYMGFSEIYLLGVDFSYDMKNNRGCHFYEQEEKDNNPMIPEVVLNDYKSARSYADSHGIKIYNATRGGKLEVFERVDFDSLPFLSKYDA